MAAKRPTAVWVSPGDGRQNRRINYDCSFIFILHFLFHRLALLCSIFIYRYFPLPAGIGPVSVQLDSTEHLQHAAWEMKHVMEGQTCVYASGVLTAGPECDAWTDPESFNQYLPTFSICPHIFSFIFITSSSCLVSSISLLLPPSCPPIGSDSSSPPRPESCFFFFSSALWSSGHTLFCAALLLPVR